MLAAAGAAWGQRPSFSSPPKYGDALKAVSNADCERQETETYLEFICDRGGAIWFFTREGRPEHPAYRAMPSYRVVPPRGTLPPSDGRSFIWLPNKIDRFEGTDSEATGKWFQQVFSVWSTSVPAVWPDPALKPDTRVVPDPRS
jgi:hypothetical protein